MTKPFDVFLSHNSVDKPWVIQLKQALDKRGLKAWLDRDEIRPGELFVSALERGLNESKAIGLVVSPESMKSGWVNEEYSRAMSLAVSKEDPIPLIPIILRQVDELPDFLTNRNWVDFRDETKFEENVEHLVWGITGAKLPHETRDQQNRGVVAAATAVSSMATPLPRLPSDRRKENQQMSAPIVNRNTNRSVNIGGNATGVVIQTGDRNVASIVFTQTTLPPPASVNIQSEFESLRSLLKSLSSPAQAKLIRALEDINDELANPDPNRDDIGDALERAINCAQKAAGFADSIDRLRTPISNIVAWLGNNWHKLLATVGMTL